MVGGVQMFKKIKKKVKEVATKFMADSGMREPIKDIFELGGVPAFNQFYYFGIFPWKYIYKGFYKPWHRVLSPTLKDPIRKRNIETMGIAKAVCAELAGLIWSEQCEVHVSSGKELGENETDPLDDYIQEVLKDNAFFSKMQEHIEQSLALGGGALKVWAEADHLEGKPVLGSEHIEIGYAMADQFVPTAWTNAKVTEGVFISREAKNGYYYTRLEWHKWNGTTYVVENELFRSEIKNIKNASGEVEPQDILGFRYPLQTIYPFLNESTSIEHVEDSLFYYYRTAIANNIDDNSPLGVSIYANALATLHALDVCYDSFVREFVLGKKRIIVPASAVRMVVDPETGERKRYFDANDEVYEALATDDIEKLKIHDNSVELRVEEHISAINAFLSTLCLQLGFSAGTFTFDKSQGLKTATEVISENSKTYKTIKSHQLQIKEAIEKMIKGIVNVADLYDIEYKGQRVGNMANDDLEIKVIFDDSILQDRQTNINEGIVLVNNGLMSKLTYMEKVLGMTGKEALKEIEKIKKENQINTIAVDDFALGGEE